MIRLYCASDTDEAVRAYNAAGDFLGQGSIELAVDSYRRAIDLDPGYCDAMDNLGVLYRRMGLLDSAVSWYGRSLAVNPDNPLPHQNLAVVHTMRKDFDAAGVEYRAIIDMEFGNPEGHYGLGHMLAVTGDHEAAIGHLLVAESLYVAQLSPVVVDARRLLAMCNMEREEWVVAREFWERCYQALENEPEVNFQLGLCCLRSTPSDLPAADRYFQRARRLGRTIPSEIARQFNW